MFGKGIMCLMWHHGCIASLLLLCVLLLIIVGLLCIVLLSCVYYCYLMPVVVLCIAVLHTLAAKLLARSQYPEGPATGHLDTGFS